MRFNRYIILASIIFGVSSINAQDKNDEAPKIPLAPLGQRWVLNENFSDEFNGDKLDDSKWLDHHPTWKGRPPALFVPEQVSVGDGYLKLTGAKLKEPQTSKWGVFDTAGAAVVSKEKTLYGYYEAKIKANKTTLSTTFWMATGGGNVSTEGRQPEDAQQGTFGQELDILECIGRSTGSGFEKGMHSNIHYWFTDKQGQKHDITAGSLSLKRQDGRLPTQDFNVYGCWWVDKSKAIVYLNYDQSIEVDFVGVVDNKKPIKPQDRKPFYFTEPMGLRLVMETYSPDWIPAPNDEELADPTKNTTYYDWVRSYYLVAIDEPVKDAKPTEIFKPYIDFIENDESPKVNANKLSLNLKYSCGEDSQITVMLYDAKNSKISTGKYNAYAGYGNGVYELEANGDIKAGNYRAVAYIKSSKKKSVAKRATFKFEIK